MTENRFRQLYEQVQAASRVVGVDPVGEAFADRLHGEARDAIIERCDSREAALMDWAMENGYPERTTGGSFPSEITAKLRDREGRAMIYPSR